MNEEISYSRILNESLGIFFKDALRVSLTNPSQARFFYRTVRWQKRAATLRAGLEQQGIHVPPIMIFSITNECNLHCKGCYAQALRESSDAEVDDQKIRSIIAEARDLGISLMVIAGGEPLVRKGFIDITKDFPEIIFLMFTNGLLLDDELLAKLKAQKNVVPVISLEGYEADTDGRRGAGVHERLRGVIGKLKKKGIFFSVSFTMTRQTFETLTDREFIRSVTGSGCKLLFFLEYTPIKEGTEDWVLTDEQRAGVMTLIKAFRKEFRALFIAVPGDEEEIGGCLSAGRGFVHVSAAGDVEPCPFAPYSDVNLRKSSLKDALQSEFLKAIRQNHEQLKETKGGCALWVERDWVRSLLDPGKCKDRTRKAESSPAKSSAMLP
jgi:MoaA/NifB/PqqE/SkfB family radical SAM enzyme